MSQRDARRIRIPISIALILLSSALLSGVSVPLDHRKLDPALIEAIEPPDRGILQGIASLFRPAGRHGVFLRASTDDPSIPDRVAELGGSVKRVAPGLFAGEIPESSISAVASWGSVAYLEKARRARKMLDAARPAVLADLVQAGSFNALPSDFRGQGVSIGVVDTGLTSGHPDFTLDGVSGNRVLHRLAPTGLDPNVDVDWHGTHVAGIAAGNGFSSAGLYRGIAPAAFLSAYRTRFTFDDIVSGMNALVSHASTDGTPIALNLSLGATLGPHDGSSGFESAVNAVATGTAGSRRVVLVAAGNEADQGEHVRLSIPPFGTSGAIRFTLSGALDPAFPPEIDIWADGRLQDPEPPRRVEYDEYTVTASIGGDTVVAPSGSTSVSSPRSLVTVFNRIDTNVPNGATHIRIRLSTSLAGQSGTVSLRRTRNGATGQVDAYSDAVDVRFPDFTGNPSGSIIEPGNADNVITVGSFNVRNSEFGAVGALSSFSSAGPTRDNRVKPDLAAPGSAIRSTRSRDPFDPSGGIQPDLVGGFDNGYAILSGTSMSTPHASGTAALVWESNPSLTGSQMRARLRRTADPVGAIPNSSWGYGRVNALRAVSEPVAAISAPVRSTPGTPVALSSADSSGSYGNPITYAWTLSGRPVGSAALLAASTPGASFTPDLPGLYTVSLTVGQSSPAGLPTHSDTATIHVNNAPVGVSIDGPASSLDPAPVSFLASGVDPDGQAISWRWTLVSRPSGSLASLVAAGSQATLSPDLSGSYTIGLRADDGLDNSALALRTFTLGSVPPPSPPPSGGGGGGCSAIPTDPQAHASGIPAGLLALLAASLPVIGSRMRGRS